MFVVRPQYSNFDPLLVLYPIDHWSKTELLKICNELKIVATEIEWGYGVRAYQFNTLEDYKKVQEFTYSEEAKARWNK